MSGHNKWSKIKNKKAATDAQKSKEFGKLSRLISVEAKKCGGDENSPGLRAAIEKARKASMPKDNIDRAIKKASEIKADMSEMLYEGYGPGGVGIIVTALTDNSNRTSPEIRHIFTQHNLSLGAQGSVTWGFTFNKEEREWTPSTTMEISGSDMDKLEKLVEALLDHDDVQDVYTNAE